MRYGAATLGERGSHLASPRAHPLAWCLRCSECTDAGLAIDPDSRFRKMCTFWRPQRGGGKVPTPSYLRLFGATTLQEVPFSHGG